MVQWPLTGVSADLKLSVPKELEQEVANLLKRVRRGHLGLNEQVKLSETWEFMGAEVTADDGVQPAIFLVRPDCLKALVVAAWPVLPSPKASVQKASPRPTFNPAGFFENAASAPPSEPAEAVEFFDVFGDMHVLRSSTEASSANGLQWVAADGEPRIADEIGVAFSACHRCTLTGPFGQVTVADPLPGHTQRKLVESVLMLATEHGVPLRCHGRNEPADREEQAAVQQEPAVSTSSSSASPLLEVALGDAVEVHYDGEWYSGVLQFVVGDVAHINCHADGPNVITMVHVSDVRRPGDRHQRDAEPTLQ